MVYYMPWALKYYRQLDQYSKILLKKIMALKGKKNIKMLINNIIHSFKQKLFFPPDKHV
jgi:hypothetical protein